MKKLKSLLPFFLIGSMGYAQINTVAGNGTAGFSGDGGQATSAKLDYPSGITFDASGNLYIADQSNNVIRKVNTSGVISTIAGNGTASFSGDGSQATAAAIYNPVWVAFDASGNLFISDAGNRRIRKVNTSGIISTVAGNGTAGFSGDGGQATAAELNSPYGITLDASNNLYIADYINNRIRMVNSSGIISTFAGGGTSGPGDGGQATSAQLYGVAGITFDIGG